MEISRISGTSNGLAGMNAPHPPKTAIPTPPAAAAPAVPNNGERVEATHTATKVETQPPEPHDAEVKRSLERINRFLQPTASNIEFAQDDETGRTVVKIVDKQTQEVLRQIPSKEAVAIAKELDKLQGLLVKEKA